LKTKEEKKSNSCSFHQEWSTICAKQIGVIQERNRIMN